MTGEPRAGLWGRVWCWLWHGESRAPIGNELGRRSESLAAEHLQKLGYTLLARNARLRRGEADLVCEAPDRRTVVVVEVKSREGGGEGGAKQIAPEVAVNHAKRRKLVAIARSLQRSNAWTDRPIRIDVVAVDWAHGRATVRHYPGAVGA